MGIKSESETPLHLNNSNKRELQDYLSEVSNDVLDLAFHPINLGNIDAIKRYKNSDLGEGEEEELYCICKEDEGGDWVKCGNKKCARGTWFHLECLGIDTDDLPEGDWYCSDECRSKLKLKKNSIENDTVHEYTKSILFRGIGDMVRHDAIKENDGPRIVMHWKWDILEFYTHHHPKYLIFAFNLLTSVAGALSPRLAHQLIWNRTVNPAGGRAKNIEMDLQMEHYNRDYKESIKNSGGQMTNDTIARHSQMVGMGKAIKKMFDVNIAERHTYHRKAGAGKRENDLKHLVKTLLHLNVFDTILGRSHSAFPDFCHDTVFKYPHQFAQRLSKHKKKLVKRMTIVADL